jgi:hypothetical protein
MPEIRMNSHDHSSKPDPGRFRDSRGTAGELSALVATAI